METQITVANEREREPISAATCDIRHIMIDLPVEQMALMQQEYMARRKQFRDWLKGVLVEGVHFGYPPFCEPKLNDRGEVGVWSKKGMTYFSKEQWQAKPSLYKAGAQFICDLLNIVPTFSADTNTWVQLGSVPGMTVQRCQLYPRGVARVPENMTGEGLGVRSIGDKSGDANNSVKMAEKCLGGRTPVLVKTPMGILRTDLHRLYLHAATHAGGMQIAGPNRTWRTIRGIMKNAPRPVLEVTVQNGSRIVCTPEHRWPLANGEIKTAAEMEVGDVIQSSSLPHGDGAAMDWIGWLVGMFLAEGSISGGTVLFHIHKKESRLAELLCEYASRLGVSAKDKMRNGCNGRVVGMFGGAVAGLMRHFINGDKSKNKRLSCNAWRQGPAFLNNLLQGYLDGDGSRCVRSGRSPFWEIGFTRKNRELRDDLKCLAAMLGVRCKIYESTAVAAGKRYNTFKGWMKDTEPKYNGKKLGEVLSIKDGGIHPTYDIEVDGDHLFCLADGIVTHNCSLVDAVLNSYGLSDLFTQDIEDRAASEVVNPDPRPNPKVQPRAKRDQVGDVAAPDADSVDKYRALGRRWKSAREKLGLSVSNEEFSRMVCNADEIIEPSAVLKVSYWTEATFAAVEKAVCHLEGQVK